MSTCNTRLVKSSRTRRAQVTILEALETRRLLATFASLQAAVDNALPGSTLTVGAGTVQELVTVNKPLIIRGAHFGVDARDASRGTGETIIRGAPLSDGKQSTSFYITASGVTIDGFTVQDDASSNKYGAGIVIAPGVHGTTIINNIVQSNVAGLYLANNSNADPCIIQHNVFRDNNRDGTNSGRGIYSDGGVSGGNLTRVIIDGNTFTGNVGFGPPDNPQAAIGMEAQKAGKQSNITITNNIMTGNGKGVLLFNVDRVTLENNVMSASTDTHSAAIRIEGGSSNITVDHNTVTGNLGAAMRVSNIFTGPNSRIIATQNNFFGNTKGGLIVDGSSYKGTLDATNNWWGSDKGPGGDGPGFGDAVIAADHNVNFTPWATAPISTTPAGSGSPRGLRQILIEDLVTIRTMITGHLRHFINDAITNFKASLADALWVDDSHLAPGAGKELFNLDRKAVNQLRHIIKPMRHVGLPDGLVETVQRVANLERMMAMISIDSAGDGDAKKLTKANHELSAGVNEVGRGNYDLAITHFMAAWELSIQAGHKAKPKPHHEDKPKEDHKKNKAPDDHPSDKIAVADLQALRTQISDKDLGKQVDQVIAKLQQAAGDNVFDLSKDTVHNLTDVAENKTVANVAAGLNKVIIRITQNMRLIAQTGIGEAHGGKSDHLRDANSELAQGDMDLANLKFDSCIDHYKNAWQKAGEALTG